MQKTNRQTKKEFLQDLIDTLSSALWEYQRGKISRQEYLKWVAFCRSSARNYGKELAEPDTEKKDKE